MLAPNQRTLRTIHLFLLILLAANRKGEIIEGKSFLFDLNADPHEANDLSDSTVTAYSTVLSTLTSRSSSWASTVTAGLTPDSTGKNTAWKKAGGVSPWVVNSTFTPATIPQKFSYKNAPNIVFVLVDDWGWNDVGYRSTYMSWTTPTIDKLAGEGVKLENYYTGYSCVPARGALLTGRYSIRLGLWAAREGAELPLRETTLGQEMQSAGYRTYMVGKWHLGFSTVQHTPLMRGFHSAYSYYNGFVDYWTKKYGTNIDLHDGAKIVTAATELSSTLHNGILMQTKAELAIATHVLNYPNQPMFLYYAMQLIHGVWAAPVSYLARCGVPSTITDAYTRNVTYNYCALNVMLDEAVANLTCALQAHGMANNTVLILVSDNGGEATVHGNSYPFRGNKGSLWRGGVSATGFVHSKLLPTAAKGTSYAGQMHVTDWLPTLMGLATNNQWKGGLFGAVLDGVDQWAALTTPGTSSPRSEILHYHNGANVSSIQVDMLKLNLGDTAKMLVSPDYVFQTDRKPLNAARSCVNPSLIDYLSSASPSYSPSNAPSSPPSVSPTVSPSATPAPSRTPSTAPSRPSPPPSVAPSSPSPPPSVAPSPAPSTQSQPTSSAGSSLQISWLRFFMIITLIVSFI